MTDSHAPTGTSSTGGTATAALTRTPSAAAAPSASVSRLRVTPTPSASATLLRATASVRHLTTTANAAGTRTETPTPALQTTWTLTRPASLSTPAVPSPTLYTDTPTALVRHVTVSATPTTTLIPSDTESPPESLTHVARATASLTASATDAGAASATGSPTRTPSATPRPFEPVRLPEHYALHEPVPLTFVVNGPYLNERGEPSVEGELYAVIGPLRDSAYARALDPDRGAPARRRLRAQMPVVPGAYEANSPHCTNSTPAAQGSVADAAVTRYNAYSDAFWEVRIAPRLERGGLYVVCFTRGGDWWSPREPVLVRGANAYAVAPAAPQPRFPFALTVLGYGLVAEDAVVVVPGLACGAAAAATSVGTIGAWAGALLNVTSAPVVTVRLPDVVVSGKGDHSVCYRPAGSSSWYPVGQPFELTEPGAAAGFPLPVALCATLIAGAVLVALVLCALYALCLWCCHRRWRQEQDAQEQMRTSGVALPLPPILRVFRHPPPPTPTRKYQPALTQPLGQDPPLCPPGASRRRRGRDATGAEAALVSRGTTVPVSPSVDEQCRQFPPETPNQCVHPRVTAAFSTRPLPLSWA